MSDAAERYREQLAALRRQFVSAAQSDGAELTALLVGARAGSWTDDDRARFRKLAHDLRGAGGAYGFDAVSTSAAGVEDAFLAGGAPDALEPLVAALVTAVAAAAETVGAAP